MEQVGSVHGHSPRECPCSANPHRAEADCRPGPAHGGIQMILHTYVCRVPVRDVPRKAHHEQALMPPLSCSMSFGALPTSDLFSCPSLTLLAYLVCLLGCAYLGFASAVAL